MAIYLPGIAEDSPLALDEMTPREVVAELDKYVVGQAAAKRAVAVALRNRLRRQKLAPELADEVMPKNILMIGSTGVGKTEIARRLARLTGSPFIKVEASKFTEVGYVGRDVEAMIRDLVENAIDDVREEKLDEIEDRAELAAEDKIVDLLAAQMQTPQNADAPEIAITLPGTPASAQEQATVPKTPAQPVPQAAADKENIRQQFREGKFDDRMVELDVRERNVPHLEVISNQPPEEMESSGLKDALANMFGARSRKRPMKAVDAFDYLVSEEEQRMLDMEAVTRTAIERVETNGIVFLDEVDKIAGREGAHGPDISREGVQRDILPIVEGTTVSTKYGNVATDHILFIAAGAFHVSKPSDLIPELQGRFPIRVELQALTQDDFLRILTEPRASLTRQAAALLETEGLKLEFAPEALQQMASFAFSVNETTENIGARRLHTILEKVLEEISFHAPDMLHNEAAPNPALPAVIEREMNGKTERVVRIEAAYVAERVAEIVKSQDLSRYIL